MNSSLCLLNIVDVLSSFLVPVFRRRFPTKLAAASEVSASAAVAAAVSAVFNGTGASTFSPLSLRVSFDCHM